MNHQFSLTLICMYICNYSSSIYVIACYPILATDIARYYNIICKAVICSSKTLVYLHACVIFCRFLPVFAMCETSVKVKILHDNDIHRGICASNCPLKQSKVQWYPLYIFLCMYRIVDTLNSLMTLIVGITMSIIVSTVLI